MSFASDCWKVVNGFQWLLKTCHIFKINVNISETQSCVEARALGMEWKLQKPKFQEVELWRDNVMQSGDITF